MNADALSCRSPTVLRRGDDRSACATSRTHRPRWPSCAAFRKGGRIVREFSTPTWKPFRSTYRNYLLLPKIAGLSASNPVAYEYLAESILAWPDQRELAELMFAAGWRGVGWKNLSGGIVALHRAH